jgi:hypothetical protein
MSMSQSKRKSKKRIEKYAKNQIIFLFTFLFHKNIVPNRKLNSREKRNMRLCSLNKKKEAVVFQYHSTACSASGKSFVLVILKDGKVLIGILGFIITNFYRPSKNTVGCLCKSIF